MTTPVFFARVLLAALAAFGLRVIGVPDPWAFIFALAMSWVTQQGDR